MTNVELGAREDVAAVMASCYADPLKHVYISYPWGSGQLKGRSGPDTWQKDLLRDVGAAVRVRKFNGVDAVVPIRFSTASGHGIGKSTIVSWLIRWIMDTRPFCKGIVTANTAEQLRTKTWAELAKWHGMGLTKDQFNLNAGRGSLSLSHLLYPETWRVDAQTCREENSEAFAGLHASNSSPFYIFDEAAGIPDKIFEVREGGLTDGEPLVFDFGNPTRNTGRFHANMIGKFRHLYNRRQIDSRDVAITNKLLFEEWVRDYGEDSDFVKVRVRGVFPNASSLQFIPVALYEDNVDLDVFVAPDDPLIMGVDVARFGDDQSVIWLRQGRDAASQGHHVYREIDTMRLVGEVARISDEKNVDAIFVDGGGVGGPVIDRLQQMGYHAIDINFGAKATQKGYANLRAQMYGNLKNALKAGIRLPASDDLRADLTGVEYGYNVHNDLQLEKKEDMKRRGLSSPDLADALALTYAMPVAPKSRGGYTGDAYSQTKHEYDPL